MFAYFSGKKVEREQSKIKDFVSSFKYSESCFSFAGKIRIEKSFHEVVGRILKGV